MVRMVEERCRKCGRAWTLQDSLEGHCRCGELYPDETPKVNLPASSPRRARRSGVLAGKLAAGVGNLLASNPKAPAEMQVLASKSVVNLLASNPEAFDELSNLRNLLASSILLAGKLPDQLAGKLRSRFSGNKLSRKGGLARAAKMSPERRREISMLGVESKRAKRAETKTP